MELITVPARELELAMNQLRDGNIVLLHDSQSRENEVDMVAAAEFVSPEHIRAMRTDAGGLLCLALGHEVGDKLGITSLHNILRLASKQYPVLQLLEEQEAPYGGRSAFSITINHRQTFTGVTDRDRALTINEMGELSKIAANGGKECRQIFIRDFRAPGHVHLLLESPGSLAERRGHTELSLYLCRLAGIAPAAAICEMLDGKSHNALSVEDARKYAKSHGIPLVEGQELVSKFSQQNSR